MSDDEPGGEPDKEELSLTERLAALTHYYSEAESEKRRNALMDKLFTPMETDVQKLKEQLEAAKPSRPAVQPERNGNDNFERILADNPWLK